MKEGLGMVIIPGLFIGSNQHDYGSLKINLHAYRCEFVSATFEMTDHDDYDWVRPDQLIEYKMAEADIPLTTELS